MSTYKHTPQPHLKINCNLYLINSSVIHYIHKAYKQAGRHKANISAYVYTDGVLLISGQREEEKKTKQKPWLLRKKAHMMFQIATSRYYLCACVVEHIIPHTVPSPS